MHRPPIAAPMPRRPSAGLSRAAEPCREPALKSLFAPTSLLTDCAPIPWPSEQCVIKYLHPPASICATFFSSFGIVANDVTTLFSSRRKCAEQIPDHRKVQPCPYNAVAPQLKTQYSKTPLHTRRQAHHPSQCLSSTSGNWCSSSPAPPTRL